MRTTNQRVTRYNEKVDPSTVGLKVGAQLDTMHGSYAAAANSIVQKEVAIQQLLNDNGTVPPIDYGFYLSFGRELWGKIRRGISGPALAKDCETLIAKWVGFGRTEDILEAVALDVFNIVLPE